MPSCPHCGSSYVVPNGTTDSFSKSSEIYYCQACKKTFSVDTAKKSAQGEWLMTLNDSPSSWGGRPKAFIEVYKTPDGKISINQKNDKDKYVSGEVSLSLYVQANPYIGDENRRYFLTISSYQSPNDSNGTLFSIHTIKMNKELTAKAKNKEAMRIVWDGSEKEFNLENYRSKAISDDICAYLMPLIGATGKSGCYVATAVYGSYDCPQVWTLRRFRDNILSETWYGRAFIRTYYAISPTLVKWFGNTNWFKGMWRGVLDNMVTRLQEKGFESTPYEDRK